MMKENLLENVKSMDDNIKISKYEKDGTTYNQVEINIGNLSTGKREIQNVKIKEEPINFIECGIQVKEEEIIKNEEDMDSCDYHKVLNQQMFANPETIDRICMEDESSSSVTLDKIRSQRRIYKCNFCKYVAKKISHLKVHERSHTGEKPFKCSECDYCATVKSHLTVHIRRHTGEKPYKCTDCSFSATQSSKIRIHALRNHSIEKPYNCNECEFKSANKASFQFHVLKHLGEVEKSYKCLECDYTTSHRYYLKIHVRRHTGEKPYKCSQCAFSCATKSGLNYHITKH